MKSTAAALFCTHSRKGGLSARSRQDWSGRQLKSRSLGMSWALVGLALLLSALLPSTGALTAIRDEATTSSSSDSSDHDNGSSRKRTVPYWSSSFTDPTN